jgi:hypothetical protein
MYFYVTDVESSFLYIKKVGLNDLQDPPGNILFRPKEYTTISSLVFDFRQNSMKIASLLGDNGFSMVSLFIYFFFNGVFIMSQLSQEIFLLTRLLHRCDCWCAKENEEWKVLAGKTIHSLRN